MQSPVRVMIVDENEERAGLIESGIRAGGYEVVARLIGRADLQEKVNEIQPDVIIIDMECPDRDTLEAMSSHHAPSTASDRHRRGSQRQRIDPAPQCRRE